MTFTEAQLSQWLADFLWPFLRIGGLFAAAPVLNLKQIPARLRVLLAVLVTWAVMPVLEPMPVVQTLSAEAFLIAFQQLGIGIAIGFLLQLAFNALIFGGQVMAYSMGLGFAHMMDPQHGVQVPMVSQYYLMLAMLAFLMANGHLVFIQLIADSFQVLPVAVDGLSRAGLWELVAWAGRMFSGGVLMALPVIIALLLVNVGKGVVSRAAPQLNIFAVGFPVTLLIGMVLLWVTLPQVLGGFSELVDEAFGVAAGLLTVR